jgi:hypothetical protein
VNGQAAIAWAQRRSGVSWHDGFSFTPTELQGDYRYELAFRQLEVSETCVFDRPQAGRMCLKELFVPRFPQQLGVDVQLCYC